jgi:hypothetical protein
MTTKSFRDRLDAIERQLNAKPGGGAFHILQISGCLPGPVNHAYAGPHRWDRAEGEEHEAFARRAAQAAVEAGEMEMVLGGLPGRDEVAKFWKPDGEFDFDAWWATIAPYYPEVPPEEPAGYVRPASKW